jgi:fibronectin-binding autotransporter adhesin
MASVSGVNWAPGTELWLRFSSLQIAGNDDGLGIDDLSFSAISTVPSLLWNNAAGTKKWNTTDANFTDGTNNALYVDSDLVTFGDTAVGSVNVDSGGVTPGSVNVTNTTGEYTFTGGSILGATALTKSNAGTLTLTASNGYTGGTTITGGMLNFSNDNQLGAASGSVTVSGGTLHATSNVTSARAISASAGTIQVDGGSTFSASGVFSDASGLFTKAGAGTFAVTGQWSVGTTSMISIPAGTVLIQPSTGSVNLSADNVGNNYVGDVLIDLTNDTGTGSSTRINFGNNEIISGGGKIKLLSSGVSLDTVGTANIVANIGNEIVLNPNNNPGAFTINLGAVGGQTLETTVISGNGAVNLATSAGSGGSGALLLNGTMTYTGGTTVNTGVAAGLGVVRLNVSDAFPTAGSITFNTATGAYAGPAPIDLNGHNQTITGLSVGAGGGTLPSILTNDLASTTSVLTINAVGSTTYSGQINDGTVSGAVMSLAKTGTGTFVFSGSGGYTGTTTVNSTGGALVLKGSTAWGPALNSAGQTDIKSGKLVFDYSTDSDPTIAVRSALATAAASSFATGQIHSSTAQVMAHPRSLGYIDDTTNQKLTVAYTLAGDANLDGTVNGLDFNALANGYGTSPASNTWTQGDYDYSGAVDSGDFALLAENYGQTIGGLNAALPDAALPASGLPASALGSVVPEPASVGMLLTCGLGLIKRRRRA